MTPWPGAFTELVRGERPEALRVIVQGCVLEGGPLSEGEPAGTILAHCEGVLQVATGSGVVRIARLQPSGKRMMDVDDFVRGHPVAPGDRFR
jgi:methionyl-tRNA formyltransferase